MNHYQIFSSPSGDWYVAAMLDEEQELTVLYEGHSRELALEAIMNAHGLSFREAEKDMEDGSYTPSEGDFR